MVHGLEPLGFTRPDRATWTRAATSRRSLRFNYACRGVTFEGSKGLPRGAFPGPRLGGEIGAMMRKIDGLPSLLTGLALGLSALLGLGSPAHAGTGQPSPWQIDFQTAVTPIMEMIHGFPSRRVPSWSR